MLKVYFNKKLIKNESHFQFQLFIIITNEVPRGPAVSRIHSKQIRPKLIQIR